MRNELLDRKSMLQKEMEDVDSELSVFEQGDQQMQYMEQLLDGLAKMQQLTMKAVTAPRVTEVVRDPKTNRVVTAISRLQMDEGE